MWSVGRTAGSLFGGFFYHHVTFLGEQDGRALYLAAGIGGLGVLSVHSVVTLLLRACGRRGLYTPPPPPLALTDPLVAPPACTDEAPTAHSHHVGCTGTVDGRRTIAINR